MSNLVRRNVHDVFDQLPTLRQDFLAPLEQEFHSLFNDFFGGFVGSGVVDRMKNKVDFPRVDAYVQDGQYIVTAIVAGVDPDDLEVELVDNPEKGKFLIISGKSEDLPQDTQVIRKEIRRSAFRREMSLPSNVCDRPEVRVKDGILTIKWQLPPEKPKDGVTKTLLWGSASNSSGSGEYGETAPMIGH
jgi:HSP20 family protein